MIHMSGQKMGQAVMLPEIQDEGWMEIELV